MTIEFLGLRWLLLIGVACTTMGSFAASGMQIQPMSGVGIGYDGAEAFNQRYDAAPGSACDNKQPKMADEGTFFGSMAQFNAAKTIPSSLWSKAEFNGTRVYQRSDLIDPAFVDARGRSNL